MNWKKATLLAPFLSFAGRLRFPWLFAITLLLFVVNIMVPDAIPFADEALLGLGALLLGSIKNRGKGEDRKESGNKAVNLESGKRGSGSDGASNSSD